nr:DUF2490 domain-containing protein [uncultured Arsenicibacter sp.]
MTRYLTALIVLFVSTISLTAHAQDPSLRLWTGIQLEKKLLKRVTIQATAQARFIENVSDLGSYIGELGAAYKLNKHWEVAGYYRFIGKRNWKPNREVYVNEQMHRFYADLSYQHKIGKIKLENRLRYQNQFTDVTREQANRDYLRNKIEVALPNKSRFTPSVSADLFYGFGLGFDVIRYRANLDIKLNKHNTITVYGFTEQELIETPDPTYTLGLTYKLKL